MSEPIVNICASYVFGGNAYRVIRLVDIFVVRSIKKRYMMKYCFWIIIIPLFSWASEKKDLQDRYLEWKKKAKKVKIYVHPSGKYARPVLKRQSSCEDLRKYIKSIHWDNDLREGNKEK
jgi:hypothetical protein